MGEFWSRDSDPHLFSGHDDNDTCPVVVKMGGVNMYKMLRRVPVNSRCCVSVKIPFHVSGGPYLSEM